jgi:hypothetical protein
MEKKKFDINIYLRIGDVRFSLERAVYATDVFHISRQWRFLLLPTHTDTSNAEKNVLLNIFYRAR